MKNAALVFIFALTLALNARAAETLVELKAHYQPGRMRQLRALGKTSAKQKVQISIPLKYEKSASAMEELIRRQQDPTDPSYRQFLTPEQFVEKFGPSAEEYEELIQDLNRIGLHAKGRHPGRMMVNVEATVAQIEKALHLELHDFQSPDEKRIRLPMGNPRVPARIAEKIVGILGLNSSTKLTFNHPPGHGMAGGFTPADIRKAYDLTGVNLDGQGETIALVEYDGYLASDIHGYIQSYGLTGTLPIKNILVDDFSGIPSSKKGSGECTLDIELALALAPRAQMLVYEGQPASPFLDVMSRIASDNLGQVVTMSWGSPEFQTNPAALQAENTVLQQMALQGQSVFIASGDSGAYAGHTANLHTANPGGQPYATSVGGTRLDINADGSYARETSWGNPNNGAGGGGGISQVWPQPAWQKGLATAANRGSDTHRMLPDVSLNAQFNNGYAIYLRGAHVAFGGTSASAPLWAAFATLVNQQRVQNGLARLGFVSPALYQIGRSSLYPSVFHDIADLSTNLFYPATPGFDLSTGWGSFKGAALLQALASPNLPPLAPTHLRVKTVSP